MKKVIMNFKLEINTNNLKTKEKFKNDCYLLELVNITTKCNDIHVLNYIRDMFYLKSLDEYENKYNKSCLAMIQQTNSLNIIYNIFKLWLPFERYNLGELRGYFLELLTVTILKQSNITDNEIFQESKVKLENYTSYTWDIIINKDNILHCYECKFSPNNIRRKHIDQIISLYNKLTKTHLNLVTFTEREYLIDQILFLRNNTNPKKYNEIISKINLITIENFVNNSV